MLEALSKKQKIIFLIILAIMIAIIIYYIYSTLYNNDFNGDLKCLKFPLYGDEDRNKLTNNTEVLELLNKVESEIDAFIEKFDKSEQAGGSPSKLNKAKEWEKVDDAAQQLIKKFQNAGRNDNFWAPLQSILDTGKRICANDSYSNFTNELDGLNGFKFGDDDRKEFSDDQKVIELMNKVESAISAFINKFYKSEQAVDINVQNKPSGKI